MSQVTVDLNWYECALLLEKVENQKRYTKGLRTRVIRAGDTAHPGALEQTERELTELGVLEQKLREALGKLHE